MCELPGYRLGNAHNDQLVYSSNMVAAIVAAQVAAERERIKAALLGMDDAVKGQHNYYAHAAWVLFERA